jgi:hypothetical protein
MGKPFVMCSRPSKLNKLGTAIVVADVCCSRVARTLEDFVQGQKHTSTQRFITVHQLGVQKRHLSVAQTQRVQFQTFSLHVRSIQRNAKSGQRHRIRGCL